MKHDCRCIPVKNGRALIRDTGCLGDRLIPVLLVLLPRLPAHAAGWRERPRLRRLVDGWRLVAFGLAVHDAAAPRAAGVAAPRRSAAAAGVGLATEAGSTPFRRAQASGTTVRPDQHLHAQTTELGDFHRLDVEVRPIECAVHEI